MVKEPVGLWGVLAKCCRLAMTIGGFASAWRVVMDANANPGLHFVTPRGLNCENAHALANAIICEAAPLEGLSQEALIQLAKAVRQVFGGGEPYGESIASLCLRFDSKFLARPQETDA